MAPQYSEDWNYGNAIYYGHFVLGRVALREGNTIAAVEQLRPQRDLARDLLAQGQAQPVLEYLAECKIFWKTNRGKVDEWIDAIRAGGRPDFGPNLNY
jgi:hypothetical protein